MFEYGPDKSAANMGKHGIGFEQAQALWDDDQRMTGPTYSGGDDERPMIIGLIDCKLWSATVTYRGDDIRIISVLRSRPNEVKAYGSEKN